jgi:hypothetical protein
MFLISDMEIPILSFAVPAVATTVALFSMVKVKGFKLFSTHKVIPMLL